MDDLCRKSKIKSRREKILSIIDELGFVNTNKLSEYFNVSRHTIRRDLNSLSKQLDLRRFHGGAKCANSLMIKCNESYKNKIKIGKEISSLVFKDSNVYIDSPYIGETFVGLLPDFNLKILTNDIYIYHLISGKENIKMSTLGGCVGQLGSDCYHANLINFSFFETVDIAVVEVDYIDSDGYILSNCLSQATRHRIALENAKYNYVIYNPKSHQSLAQYIYKVYSVEKIGHLTEIIK
ncbi:DeoR/GlpR transcriptional regulator [Vibrio aestuarianus]|uniref:DeoR family transcriptional regulator n=1 Tax=Vibrio aestuarianus TaxID=28171 RepID=UPI001558F951|nr:DeoR family transcriptional regulator [Vibrio aestuarianus]NGZ14739.1 DeoR/GlpR transcriptional regulator [Vibrio aestuarianus]NKZ50887.1 DeoR/GlpR transcriptional regulator [Vibrio aestuarianus]